MNFFGENGGSLWGISRHDRDKRTTALDRAKKIRVYVFEGFSRKSNMAAGQGVKVGVLVPFRQNPKSQKWTSRRAREMGFDSLERGAKIRGYVFFLGGLAPRGT